MNKETILVLLIEDNPGDARLIQELLKESRRFYFNLTIQDTLSEGLEMFLKNKFDIILLDLNLPDSFGLNTVSIIHEKIKDIPIIVLTGRADEELALKSLKLGSQDYLVKGKIDSILLERSISYAVERHNVMKVLRSSENKIREALYRSNFYKDLFIHDVNNIFQGILSATQLYNIQCENSEDSKYTLDITDIIEDQIKRGSKLISNVQKLSQLEEIKMQSKPLSVQSFLLKSIKNLKSIYQNYIINIQINSPCVNLIVKTNEYLKEIIGNILSNAVIHNDNPIVEIIIRISEENIHEINYIKLEFIDNGIG
ncbi:unnamed protein product, partial [marine sediment metagenome]